MRPGVIAHEEPPKGAVPARRARSVLTRLAMTDASYAAMPNVLAFCNRETMAPIEAEVPQGAE